MGYIASITFFALLWVVYKRSRFPWWVSIALAVLGATSLAYATVVGEWGSGLLAKLSGGAGGLIGAPGGLVITALALIVLVAVGYDIAVDKRADRVAIGGVIALVFLLGAATGPLGELGDNVGGGIGNTAPSTLSGLLGG